MLRQKNYGISFIMDTGFCFSWHHLLRRTLVPRNCMAAMAMISKSAFQFITLPSNFSLRFFNHIIIKKQKPVLTPAFLNILKQLHSSFFDSCALTASFAQIVQFGATNFTNFIYQNRLNIRRIKRKHSFYTNTV